MTDEIIDVAWIRLRGREPVVMDFIEEKPHRWSRRHLATEGAVKTLCGVRVPRVYDTWDIASRSSIPAFVTSCLRCAKKKENNG